MKRTLLVLFILAFLFNSRAQDTRFVVKFKDKVGTPYSISNPSQFLSARSIARRTRQNIPVDETDLPITPRYLDSIRLAGAVTILNVSKWLNQVAIYTTDAAALAKINSFPFVITTQAVRHRIIPGQPQDKFADPGGDAGPLTQQPTSNYYDYGSSYAQIHIHNGDFLHNQGFRGDNMLMSIMDAGFYGYKTNPLLASLLTNGQIKEAYNFVDPSVDVNTEHWHGMHCLSIIGANDPGQIVGSCPNALFYLYQTEDNSSESPMEEQNWVAAAERADSIGVDVISTSLGYTQFDNPAFNHTYADMNGKTTIIAKGNAMAARKGMLSVVAAGNDGSGSWHYIDTPADSDSTVTVGAVSTAGVVAGFSSYGPSYDGRVKPDVASVGVGTFHVETNGTVGAGNGTSYACPNMAGLVTCLWEAFQEVTNMQVISALQKSSTTYTAPNNRIGYGIPDVKKAFVILLKQLYTQQSSTIDIVCKTDLNWRGKAGDNMTFVVERKLASESDYSQVGTVNATGSFAIRNFTFSDDLAAIAEGVIKYRLKQTIGTDTTFYLDSLTLTHDPPTVSIAGSSTLCNENTLLTANATGGSGTVSGYQWYFNGLPVSTGGTTSTYLADAEGTYKVTVTSDNGCSTSATLLVTKGCENHVIISYNPTTETIILKNAGKVSLILYNDIGQKVYIFTGQQPAGAQQYHIPLNAFSRGIYFLKVLLDDKKLAVKKIVK
jgi:serine protease AprX